MAGSAIVLNVVLIILVGVCAASYGPFNQHMKPHKLSGMTRVAADQPVLILQYESPLMMEQFKDKGGWFHLYHTSLGAVLPDGLNATLEFTANDFYGVFIPRVVNQSRLVWNNSAAVHAKEGLLDTTYWTKRTPLALVTGSQYNSLLDWVEDQKKSRYSEYYMWNLETEFTTSVQSVTCLDFVVDLVQHLGLPVTARVSGDKQHLFAAPNSVNLVDSKDLREVQQISEFYTRLTQFIHDLPSHPLEAMEMVAKFLSSMNRTAYLNAPNGTYYRFKPMIPFLNYDYGIIDRQVSDNNAV